MIKINDFDCVEINTIEYEYLSNINFKELNNASIPECTPSDILDIIHTIDDEDLARITDGDVTSHLIQQIVNNYCRDAWICDRRCNL